MREILFRGKRLDNGEWVEGCLVTGYWYRDDKAMVTIMPVDNIFYHMGEVSGWNEVDPSTIGQYTGLCDKNGKKIFEGDIVKTLRYATAINDIEPIEYYDGGFTPFAIPGWECTIEPRDVTVIGNKWNNPELLEGGG